MILAARVKGLFPKTEFTPAEAENLLELFHEGDEVEVFSITPRK